LSRNDVGFDVARLGASVADFHRACANRLATFPDAMLATATHDHKRGEDLRARLAVISEIPEEWAAFLAQRSIGATLLDPVDEIMLYQMIVGAWPLELSFTDEAGCKAFAERLAAWQQKALREAKLHTNWTAPNEEYEAAASNFLYSLLMPQGSFLPAARAFIDMIAPAGALNGLVQAVLKMTVPGMPDFFQGTEFWDFSLVDPDNRRPVDYAIRREALAAGVQPGECQREWRDGRVKQAVICKVLALRQQASLLFALGDYLPLPVTGPLGEQIVAFARKFEKSAAIVVVPRLARALLSDGDRILLDRRHLSDCTVTIPQEVEGRSFRSLWTGGPVAVGAELQVQSLLADFPMAILHTVESA
jgi:(1->4)-alpha-D-glucan 1-alpha-D-glucosylmutase